jgi:hypothetical protein
MFWIVPSTQAYLKSRELESIAHPNGGQESRISFAKSRRSGRAETRRSGNSSSLQLYQTSIEVKGEVCPLKAILLRP